MNDFMDWIRAFYVTIERGGNESLLFSFKHNEKSFNWDFNDLILHTIKGLENCLQHFANVQKKSLRAIHH